MPEFATSDLDQARQYMSGVFRSHALRFAIGERHLGMHHRQIRIGGISLHDLSYGGRVVLDAPEMENFLLFQVNLAGATRIVRGGEAMEVGLGGGYVVGPDQTFAKHWSADGRQITIRVDRDRLENHLRVHLDGEPSKRLVFGTDIVDEAAGVLQSLASFHESLCAMAPNVSARLARSIEETILTTLLSVFPHTLSDEFLRPAPPCAPYYVRRAEEFVRSAPGRPITLEDLVQASGVSARTLHYGFRRFRDTTPLAFVKDCRLAHARKRLIEADPSLASITEIAFECGYLHPGRFSSDYRKRYGEPPSQTLRLRG